MAAPDEGTEIGESARDCGRSPYHSLRSASRPHGEPRRQGAYDPPWARPKRARNGSPPCNGGLQPARSFSSASSFSQGFDSINRELAILKSEAQSPASLAPSLATVTTTLHGKKKKQSARHLRLILAQSNLFAKTQHDAAAGNDVVLLAVARGEGELWAARIEIPQIAPNREPG